MTWVSERNLVAAISNAGGFGVIASGSMPPELLDAEIAATAALTEKPFGVNLITMHPQLLELIDVCLARRVGHVVLAGGIPSRAAIHAHQARAARASSASPRRWASPASWCAWAPMRSSSRAARPAVISGRSRPRSWRRRCCRISTRCRCSSPAGSGAARQCSSYLEMGAAGRSARHPFCLRPRIDRPSALQAGLHPRRGARRGAVDPARRALSGDPGARARQPGDRAVSRGPARVIDRFNRRRAVAEGGAARDRAFLGRRAAPRGDRRRRRSRLADGRAERRHGDARAKHRGHPRRAGRPGACRARRARGNRTPDRRSAFRGPPRGAGVRRNASQTGGGRQRNPPAACAACAVSWPAPAPRRSGSTRSSGRSPPRWSPRSARPMSCAPARCSSCSPPKGCGREAVHRTRLRVGEGLVGAIAATARPLALADAQSHPDFAYRPETGEEIYHSLMGVPILRGGRVLGRAGGAEPHAAPLHRGRDRGAADDRDDRRRAGRQRRAGQPARDGAKPRRRVAAGAAGRDPAQSRPGGRPGGAARARAS